ncbi:glycoside hydrolase family 127 protein [Rhodococcus sp. MEB064]|uniref:glycoside hydrolase family 127 protein n=1 Tax=Rhodococcus sp. MEB064 TaxID=1587522 RepID=UPI0018CE0879|nr:beta-L-arabinofuranosidase domain-containing protein [Rhodococcus sp. MEB064]
MTHSSSMPLTLRASTHDDPTNSTGADVRIPAVPVAPTRSRLRPLGVGEVTITGGPWERRQDANATATLAHIEHWLEHEGWLGNFDATAAGESPAGRTGREFSDSEVYKLLEALAWEHGRSGDPGVDRRIRAITARIAAAQHRDGYLNTVFGRPGGPARWSDLEWGHELYCLGHLFQAGVARARTSGFDELLAVCTRAADLVCEVFGPDGRDAVCGHPEIEPALVELYRVTGTRRYLDQAELFVHRRGRHLLGEIEFGSSYFQDDIPVLEADVLRGHAVRATYLSSGAVDVAVETGNTELLGAIVRQWENTVARRTYLTGGMGSRHQDEAYGEDFVLPPDRAYSETCAGIGSVQLAWRLLLAEGSPRYADLIERTLYNVVAAGPSDSGTAFFYTNTLHQRVLGTVPDPTRAVPRAASSLRAPWFAVSCCPTNVARTFASLQTLLATADDDGIQLHQYAPATITTTLPGGRRLTLSMRTEYPRAGRVEVYVDSAPSTPVNITFRVPGWAVGATLTDRGVTRSAAPGTVTTTRVLVSGDLLVLELPIAPRLTVADSRIDAVRGTVAVERGPQVLCLESVDMPDRRHVDDFVVDPARGPVDDGGDRIRVHGWVHDRDSDPWPYHSPGSAAPQGDSVSVVLRPYSDWAERGPSTMRVFLPVSTPTEES